jgi:hypothetical protein
MVKFWSLDVSGARTAKVNKVHGKSTGRRRCHHRLTYSVWHRTIGKREPSGLFVGAMRRRLRDGDAALARDDFEDWCHWALTEADNLDPAKNLAKFSIESQQEK